MHRRSFPKPLALFLVGIFMVHMLATANYWYWSMRWFDKPMHFAGGAWLAGVALWWRFFKNDSRESPRGFFHLIVWGAGVAFFVGLGWETYESVVSLVAVGHVNDLLDTAGDLAFDFLGGLVSVAYVYYIYLRPKTIS